MVIISDESEKMLEEALFRRHECKEALIKRLWSAKAPLLIKIALLNLNVIFS